MIITSSSIQEITVSDSDILFCVNKYAQTQEKITVIKINGTIIKSFNLKAFFESKESDLTYIGTFDCNDKELKFAFKGVVFHECSFLTILILEINCSVHTMRKVNTTHSPSYPACLPEKPRKHKSGYKILKNDIHQYHVYKIRFSQMVLE